MSGDNEHTLWQVAGRLEAKVERLVDGQAQIRADVRGGRKETNRKVDKMIYGGVGIGVGLFALLIMEIIGRAT